MCVTMVVLEERNVELINEIDNLAPDEKKGHQKTFITFFLSISSSQDHFFDHLVNAT
jgi:hypothetical protein